MEIINRFQIPSQGSVLFVVDRCQERGLLGQLVDLAPPPGLPVLELPGSLAGRARLWDKVADLYILSSSLLLYR